MEEVYTMCREEIDIRLKLCSLNAGGEASLPPYLRRLTLKMSLKASNTRSSPDRYATHNIKTVVASL